MVRYILNKIDILYMSPTPELVDRRNEKAIIVHKSNDPIFVNILECYNKNDVKRLRIKLFYSGGMVLEGWVPTWFKPIFIMNDEELLDGRFNA